MKPHKLGTYRISLSNIPKEYADSHPLSVNEKTRFVEVTHPDGKSAKGLYQPNKESMNTVIERLGLEVK